MSGLLNNSLFLSTAAAAGGQRSLRFNSSDSAYLSRTPAVAGSRTTWTWAGWVKVSKQQVYPDQKGFFFAGSSTSNSFRIMFQGSNGELRIDNDANGSNVTTLLTTQVFRDFSAWMHIVLAVDTTQATPSNRFKIYVNGTQVTTFSTATYQAQNTDTLVNSTNAHSIGILTNHSPTYPFDGYLADIHFIDGQALTPSSFTEVSATTGQLIPKAYTGTFGTNGFWLKFSDNSAATAATLGKDYSGNSNNWTPNNLSVTAGAGNDSLVDTPTSYGTDTGVGGEVRGNYATWNPLNASGTLSDGNLHGVTSTGGTRSLATTVAVSSGKFYVEITCSNVPVGSYGANLSIGVSLFTFPIDSNSRNYSFADGVTYFADGTKYVNGSNSSYGASYATNDVIGIAIDIDSNQITFYKNGVSQGAISKTFSGAYVITVTEADSSQQSTVILNAGQRPFAYQTPGTNRPAATFKALCDTNLGAPLVAKGNTVMDVVLWTGNGAARSITGLAFSPDWVWVKSRSAATGHKLIDSVRGATFAMAPGGSFTTDTNGLTAFTSDGFSLGTDTNYNNTSATYVGWCWDTGGTTTTETSPGTVSVDRRVNVSAGFSVAKFTSAGSGDFSIAHGLGVAPSFVLISAATTYHASVCTTTSNYFNFQNATGLLTQSTIWGAALPTSSVVSMTVGGAVSANQANVAYCFAPVVGYTSAGSYTGNGSADGPFVYTSMRPRWILLKRTDSTGNWTILDTAREGYNVDNDPLFPNLTDAEGTADLADILSNGFKLRSTDASVNASGGTYIYYAISETAFQYSRAR